MRKFLPALTLVGTLGVIGPAYAAAPEFYLGAGYGRWDVNDNNFDQNDNAWKAYAGFNFTDWLGIEASWVDFKRGSDNNSEFEADGWGGAAVLSLPVSDRFFITAKAGEFFWNAKATTGGPGGVAIDDDGSDPFYGAGVKFMLSDLLDLRLEYERFKIAETDLNMPSVSLQFSF